VSLIGSGTIRKIGTKMPGIISTKNKKGMKIMVLSKYSQCLITKKIKGRKVITEVNEIPR